MRQETSSTRIRLRIAPSLSAGLAASTARSDRKKVSGRLCRKHPLFVLLRNHRGHRGSQRSAFCPPRQRQFSPCTSVSSVVFFFKVFKKKFFYRACQEPFFQIPLANNCFVAAADQPRLAAGLAGLGWRMRVIFIADEVSPTTRCRHFSA